MQLSRLVIRLALVGLLVGCATQEPTAPEPARREPTAPAAPAEPVYEVTASRLNVRQAANGSGALAGTLTQGERVTAPYESLDGWLYVQSEGGLSGYVAERYLRRIEATTASENR